MQILSEKGRFLREACLKSVMKCEHTKLARCEKRGEKCEQNCLV